MKILAQSAILLLAACANGHGTPAHAQSTTQRPLSQQTINGIAVPPEPDPTVNNATLIGVDSNNNGIRDDVERKIATWYSGNAARYEGAMRTARLLQAYMVANGDPVKSKEASLNGQLAIMCDLMSTYEKPSTEVADRLEPMADVEKLVLNTDDRKSAHKAALYFATAPTPEQVQAQASKCK